MNLKDELTYIDNYFRTTPKEVIAENLKKCGLQNSMPHYTALTNVTYHILTLTDDEFEKLMNKHRNGKFSCIMQGLFIQEGEGE